MGDNSKTDNKVVESRSPVEVEGYEDIWIFMPTGESETLGVKISFEIYCQDSDQDKRVDLTIDLAEAITKTMVGMYGFTPKAHLQEHKGTFRV